RRIVGHQPTSSSRREYGWVIVATLCVTETITWGVIFYGFPVFLAAMEQDLGASRIAVTGAFSIGLAVSGVAGVPVGRWLDRHGDRAIDRRARSEEHTSELQSRSDLVCRLLLEKKNQAEECIGYVTHILRGV